MRKNAGQLRDRLMELGSKTVIRTLLNAEVMFSTQIQGTMHQLKLRTNLIRKTVK
jgi:hypothetical protein